MHICLWPRTPLKDTSKATWLIPELVITMFHIIDKTNSHNRTSNYTVRLKKKSLGKISSNGQKKVTTLCACGNHSEPSNNVQR